MKPPVVKAYIPDPLILIHHIMVNNESNVGWRARNGLACCSDQQS
jgi:hypothetical protein